MQDLDWRTRSSEGLGGLVRVDVGAVGAFSGVVFDVGRDGLVRSILLLCFLYLFNIESNVYKT